MRWLVAAALAVALSSPAVAQGPALTLEAALEEAWRAYSASALPTDTGHTETMAEMRRAFTDLSVARTGLALYEAQAPILLDMGESGASPDDMNRHDPTRAAVMARVATMRTTWRERVQLAEIRLAAALGRSLDLPVPPLTPRRFVDAVPEAERVALERSRPLAEAQAALRGANTDPAGTAAARARRDAIEAGVRRQVREALVRVNAARERHLIVSTTLVPQMQHAYDTARLAYASRRVTLMDVIDSYRLLLEARLEDVSAGGALERARVELEIVMGEPAAPPASDAAPAREP